MNELLKWEKMADKKNSKTADETASIKARIRMTRTNNKKNVWSGDN